MADTIPGGATLKEDGRTWQDSEGRPLKSDKVSDFKEAQSQRHENLAKAEVALQTQAAAARSVLVMQSPEATAARNARPLTFERELTEEQRQAEADAAAAAGEEVPPEGAPAGEPAPEGRRGTRSRG